MAVTTLKLFKPLEKQRRDAIETGLRQIDFEGRIDEGIVAIVGEIISILNGKGSEEITLQILSRGGDVAAGFQLYEIIKASPSPIIGVVLEANSMAVIALQACARRWAYKPAKLRFHNIRMERNFTFAFNFCPWDKLSHEALKILRAAWEEMEADQNRYCDIIAARARLDPQAIQLLCENERVIDAAEALELGLIDEII